jgi:hypothetical protein
MKAIPDRAAGSGKGGSRQDCWCGELNLVVHFAKSNRKIGLAEAFVFCGGVVDKGWDEGGVAEMIALRAMHHPDCA